VSDIRGRFIAVYGHEASFSHVRLLIREMIRNGSSGEHALDSHATGTAAEREEVLWFVQVYSNRLTSVTGDLSLHASHPAGTRKTKNVPGDAAFHKD
jgi:hypothetical protein